MVSNELSEEDVKRERRGRDGVKWEVQKNAKARSARDSNTRRGEQPSRTLRALRDPFLAGAQSNFRDAILSRKRSTIRIGLK